MKSPSQVLFVFPYDWLTSPRSTREVSFLETKGYEPTVIWTKQKYLAAGANISSSPQFNVSAKNMRVYKVPFLISPLKSIPRSIIGRLLNVAFFLLSIMFYSFNLFLLTLAVCATNRIKIIHVHNTPDIEAFIVLLVSKITRKPYVFEMHDHTPELYAERMGLKNNSIVFKFLKIIEQQVISNSTGIIFVSETSQKLVDAQYNLHSTEFTVIYSGPPKYFLKSYQYGDNELQATLESNSMSGKSIILYLGSMEEDRRGLEVLVKGIGHLVNDYKQSNIALVFVGDGYKMEDRLKQIASCCKISAYVSFQGKLPRKEAYKWLTLADIVVDPLRKRASTLACVTNKDLEYMGAHKVILASDVLGHKEILNNCGNGLLFADGDSYDLSEKLFFALTNSENELEKLRNNAWRDFSERFCWEKQEPKLIGLYERVIRINR